MTHIPMKFMKCPPKSVFVWSLKGYKRCGFKMCQNFAQSWSSKYDNHLLTDVYKRLRLQYRLNAMQGIIPFPKYPSTRKWNMINWHKFRMLEGDLWQHWPNYFGILIWEFYLYFLSRRYGQNFAVKDLSTQGDSICQKTHDISRASSSFNEGFEIIKDVW